MRKLHLIIKSNKKTRGNSYTYANTVPLAFFNLHQNSSHFAAKFLVFILLLQSLF